VQATIVYITLFMAVTNLLTKVMEGIFAINKPSGMTSRLCLDKVNRILSQAECFKPTLKALAEKRNAGRKSRRNRRSNKLKMGHGGTLDPLASGVLILGVGSGTKRLGGLTNHSTKIYEAEALLGGETTTGDSDGELSLITENDFITKELLESTAQKFIGTVTQTPPIFSALKMNGIPLYEYARKNIPLPRKIKSREVQIHSLDLCDDCLTKDHKYPFLQSKLCDDGTTLVTLLQNNKPLQEHVVSFSKEYLERAERDSSLSTEAVSLKKANDLQQYNTEGYKAPLLHFIATVSSGTYIRSLITDLGRALGSSAYMVSLIRRRQDDWLLDQNTFELSDFENYEEDVWGPVLKRVFEEGPKVNIREAMAEAIANRKIKKVEEPLGKEVVDNEEITPSDNITVVPRTSKKE